MRRKELSITALAITAILLFSCALPTAGNSAGGTSSGVPGGQTRATASQVEFNRIDSPDIGGEAKSVCVSGGTVYRAGRYFNGSKYVACYWTNTDRTDLPIDASLEAIYVTGGKVYTAGSYLLGTQTGLQNIAAYWVGQNRTDLVVSGNSYANSIFVVHGMM